MSRLCPCCGKELNDEVAFCGECGTTVAAQTAAVSTAEKNSAYEISSNGVVVSSPQPFEDTMKTFHTALWIVVLIIAILCIALYGIPGFVYGIAFAFVFSRVEYKKFLKCTRPLEAREYRYINNGSYKELFADMQPIFVGKYNYVAELGQNCSIRLTNKNFTYIITPYDDGTFTIKFIKPFARIIFSINDYLDYKKLISDMAIIAYEIQSKYGINK